MEKNEIKKRIESVFSKQPLLKGLGEDEDFFDSGASSLTIVDMQLKVEKLLGKSVETSVLMAKPTINGWVSTYLSCYSD